MSNILFKRNDNYCETIGLKPFINKELRVTIRNKNISLYTELLQYISNYIINNNVQIENNQNIIYYS